jgi:tetratricopeptide (TPR) repeat protein
VTALPDGRGPVRSVLEEEREFFLRSLRDLEAERDAGDIDDVDYRSLRDDYTVRAAEVVRRLAALEGGVAHGDAAAVSPPAGAPSAPAGADVPAASAVALSAPVGDGVLSASGPAPSAGLRRRRRLRSSPGFGAGPLGPASDASAGDASAGDASAGDTSAGGGPDREGVAGAGLSSGESGGYARIVSPWRRRVFVGAAVLIVAGGVAFAVTGMSGSTQSATTRVKNLDVAALDATGNRQYEKALTDYEDALKIQPTDVLTLTGEGELLVEMGSDGSQTLLDLGMTRLRSAEIANPSYGPAFGARGIGFYDQGNYAAAIPQFETYLADTPKAKRAPAIQQALTAAKKRLAAKTS